MPQAPTIQERDSKESTSVSLSRLILRRALAWIDLGSVHLPRVSRGEGLVIPRKEVIQPHLPVRLPCYDFTPVTWPTFDGCLSCELAHRLQVFHAPMV